MSPSHDEALLLTNKQPSIRTGSKLTLPSLIGKFPSTKDGAIQIAQPKALLSGKV